MKNWVKNALSYTQLIVLGFLLVIIIGAGLLCLPIASRTGESTPLLSSLFTATSSTCVTGLIVFDTYTHWSFFGQLVIILLIQIGGLGLMTVITLFTLFLKRQISLHGRRLAMQSAGNLSVSGTITLIKRILLLTLIFESLGASILAIRFVPLLGWKEGLWYSIFHSISAFCNAGFDLMGQFKQSSFCAYNGDPIINGAIMFLIVSGGLGFLVWNDMFTCHFRMRKFSLHTRIVLLATGLLILGGTLTFFFSEAKGVMAHMGTGERWLTSMFQAVTPRTAGFNTVDQALLSETGSIMTMVLMFIGGSPGSTAGGIKTTTFVVLILGTICNARNEKNIVTFKRRVENDTLRQCSAIANLYLFAVILSTMLICAFDGFGMKATMFEVISAIGTVGLTMGITSLLSAVSQIILIILMYVGRVGALSLAVAFAENRNRVSLERPTEKILVG